MARIDLQRVVKQFTKALHQELIAYPLGPLGPEVSAEPETTFQQFTIYLPLEETGAEKDTVKRAAYELGASIRLGRPGYIARMPMPDSGDGVRCDDEAMNLSVLVQFKPADPIYLFGALVFDVVAGPPPSRVH